MHDVIERTGTSRGPSGPSAPTTARRLRGYLSFGLFLVVGYLHTAMPVADIRAVASGPGWEASHEADVVITGGSRSGHTREVNEVPRDVERALMDLSGFDPLPVVGFPALVLGLGSLLSIRWRRGAIYGGAAAVVWLGVVLQSRAHLEAQVAGVDWPGSIELTFRSRALALIVAAHCLLVLWHVARYLLDRREDRLVLEPAT